MINNGDIFITKLDRKFFGAFRIIKTKGKFDFSDYEFYLISVTNFIDTKKPEINDIRLIQPLIESRFFYNNEPNINIYSGKIIEKNFEFLGNIPLTENEKKLKIKIGDGTDGGFPLCGAVEKNFGFEAFLEWRWNNENELVLSENEEQKKRVEELRQNIVMEPKKMMGDKQFWNIISIFNWNEVDCDKIVEPAIMHLAKLKVSDIKQFEENLTYKLYCLDTKEHAKNIGESSYKETDNYFSVDFFLYARCKAVANGQLFYETVLKDPTKMPKDKDFEVLLSISDTAYEHKAKKEFDYSTGCDYETFSNKEGWK
nr:DUF4240 domain-containing protein [uncultured Flavobacterium sp.]